VVGFLLPAFHGTRPALRPDDLSRVRTRIDTTSPLREPTHSERPGGMVREPAPERQDRARAPREVDREQVHHTEFSLPTDRPRAFCVARCARVHPRGSFSRILRAFCTFPRCTAGPILPESLLTAVPAPHAWPPGAAQHPGSPSGEVVRGPPGRESPTP